MLNNLLFYTSLCLDSSNGYLLEQNMLNCSCSSSRKRAEFFSRLDKPKREHVTKNNRYNRAVWQINLRGFMTHKPVHLRFAGIFYKQPSLQITTYSFCAVISDLQMFCYFFMSPFHSCICFFSYFRKPYVCLIFLSCRCMGVPSSMCSSCPVHGLQWLWPCPDTWQYVILYTQYR